MNRAVMTRRAAENGRTNRPNLTGPGASPSTSLLARVSNPKYGHGAIRRSRAVKMTGAQRNSEGGRSEWSASMTYWTDAKWGSTVSTVGP